MATAIDPSQHVASSLTKSILFLQLFLLAARYFAVVE